MQTNVLMPLPPDVSKHMERKLKYEFEKNLRSRCDSRFAVLLIFTYSDGRKFRIPSARLYDAAYEQRGSGGKTGRACHEIQYGICQWDGRAAAFV